MTSRYMSYVCALKVANWRISHIHAFFNQELLAFCTKNPLPAYLFREDFKKTPLSVPLEKSISHFASLSSDAGMLVTRTRWKKPKPRIKILRMELDGILDEFSGWVRVGCSLLESGTDYQVLSTYISVYWCVSCWKCSQCIANLWTFTCFFVSGAGFGQRLTLLGCFTETIARFFSGHLHSITSTTSEKNIVWTCLGPCKLRWSFPAGSLK